MTSRDNELVDVGKILGRFHLDNRIKVVPYTNTIEEFLSIGEYYIKTLTGFKKIDIKFEQNAGKHLIYSIDNINPEMIDLLKGKEIYSKYENLPSTNENEFYVYDLEKCEVFDYDENPLGKVSNVLEGGNKIFIEFSTYIIPFSRRYIDKIDTKKGKIILSKVFSDEKDFL